jgi:outer membrane protein OmpA-like peptidoglycan-associated protein
MTRGQTTLIMAVVAALPFAGCATKGYVNNRVAELRTETGQRMDTLQNSTADALARAESASGSAIEARELALGRAGLEEISSTTVLFGFDRDELTDDAMASLDQVAREIQLHPEVIIDVYGFADPTGSERYNLDLGQRRAMAVMRHLVDQTPGQLSKYAAVSFGEQPMRGREVTGGNSEARRVVVSLIRRIPLATTSTTS